MKKEIAELRNDMAKIRDLLSKKKTKEICAFRSLSDFTVRFVIEINFFNINWAII